MSFDAVRGRPRGRSSPAPRRFVPWAARIEARRRRRAGREVVPAEGFRGSSRAVLSMANERLVPAPRQIVDPLRRRFENSAQISPGRVAHPRCWLRSRAVRSPHRVRVQVTLRAYDTRGNGSSPLEPPPVTRAAFNIEPGLFEEARPLVELAEREAHDASVPRMLALNSSRPSSSASRSAWAGPRRPRCRASPRVGSRRAFSARTTSARDGAGRRALLRTRTSPARAVRPSAATPCGVRRETAATSAASSSPTASRASTRRRAKSASFPSTWKRACAWAGETRTLAVVGPQRERLGVEARRPANARSDRARSPARRNASVRAPRGRRRRHRRAGELERRAVVVREELGMVVGAAEATRSTAARGACRRARPRDLAVGDVADEHVAERVLVLAVDAERRSRRMNPLRSSACRACSDRARRDPRAPRPRRTRRPCRARRRPAAAASLGGEPVEPRRDDPLHVSGSGRSSVVPRSRRAARTARRRAGCRPRARAAPAASPPAGAPGRAARR